MVIRAYVLDETGQPVSNATVEIAIYGPETAILTSNPSDANGLAEASWQTKSPGKRNSGTAIGSYTATTKNVTASGFTWDNVTASTGFLLQ